MRIRIIRWTDRPPEDGVRYYVRKTSVETENDIYNETEIVVLRKFTRRNLLEFKS